MKTLKNIALFLGISSTMLIAKPYIELKTGACLPQKTDAISYKKAPSINGELGYKLNNQWRLSLQLSFNQYINKEVAVDSKHSSDIFNHDVRHITNCRFTTIGCMANIYYDYRLNEKTSFNFGIGVGLLRLKYHFFDNSDNIGGGNIDYNLSKTIFAAQIMAGITYDISTHWSVLLGYRCMKMENLRFNNQAIDTMNVLVLALNNDPLIKSLKTPYLHSLELGLRYSF